MAATVKKINGLKVAAIASFVVGGLFVAYAFSQLHESNSAWMLIVSMCLVGAGVIMLLISRNRGFLDDVDPNEAQTVIR